MLRRKHRHSSQINLAKWQTLVTILGQNTLGRYNITILIIRITVPKKINRTSLVAQMVKRLSTMRETGSIPGSGRFPGEGNGNPLQYSCLENPMDGGAWCRLLSMGSQRVGHDWATSLSLKKIKGTNIPNYEVFFFFSSTVSDSQAELLHIYIFFFPYHFW